MELFREIKPTPWQIRMGFWVCLALYVVSFVLPADLDRPRMMGFGMFLSGCLGLMMAVFGPVHAIMHPEPTAWSEIGQMWLAVLPWFANPVMWFALAHFRLENGRPALRTALTAVLLASGFVLLPFVLDKTWGLSVCPAYFAWIGSMACLAIFSVFLARHNREQWVPCEFPSEQVRR